LHIEEAIESINFNAAGVSLPITTVGRLLDCEYFKIDKGHQAKDCEMLLSPGRMKTLIILAGSGAILGADGTSVEFEAGNCLLVPAVYEGAMQFADDTQYLTVTS
jgi:hypothetical protein